MKIIATNNTINGFTPTAKALLQVEANDALIANNVDHLSLTAIADTTDPVDMSAEVPDNTVLSNVLTVEGDTSDYDRRIASLQAIADAIAKHTAQAGITKTVHNAITTTINASVTPFALDALSGTKRNVKVEFFLDDDAAATFTCTVHRTRIATPTTFIQEFIPAIAAIATPADGHYSYELGDLAKGLQLEFRVAQSNAGDATNALEGVLTYEE